jgi:DNA processing protein
MSILFIKLGEFANIFLMQVFRVTTSQESNLSLLCKLAQPVEELFYKGPLLDLLNQPRVAIVGSRKATPYGRFVTIKLATELARAGVVIISGLALGVDSIAHQACLQAGGRTIAVLPSSVSRVYPAQHRQLAQEITTHGGALVSEYSDTPSLPMKYQFIARNRIIAGLAQAVIITEAAQRSGSLHTANFALEQGIDVFAVPGNITSANSAGTNNLIKTGAQPITESSDILEALNITAAPNNGPSNVSPVEATIIKSLQTGPLTTTELVNSSGLGAANLLQTLTLLELRGAVKNLGNSSWMLM